MNEENQINILREKVKELENKRLEFNKLFKCDEEDIGSIKASFFIF